MIIYIWFYIGTAIPGQTAWNPHPASHGTIKPTIVPLRTIFWLICNQTECCLFARNLLYVVYVYIFMVLSMLRGYLYKFFYRYRISSALVHVFPFHSEQYVLWLFPRLWKQSLFGSSVPEAGKMHWFDGGWGLILRCEYLSLAQ